MTSTTTTATATATIAYQHLPLHKSRTGAGGGRADRGRAGYSIRKYPQHLLAYSIISILVFLCWLPDFIVALKDVSVTIPQAVKRGSNAMLTCNYDMENDTLYSVKWYKGRREFYRYTPKENPAMKVFLTQSGLNVERNLSNQSHVVLLAVPLNISGKFTCEISVEAPSFQTAMVSGEMEVVELPEEQASVTGIQPRYRIGDLVDGNCSIKYSKPAANLTWTINGIVVPPHHIKTYQIEKYEETNLESVMSAVHFMVTTQHFIKAQMRLKCTASIFDIFKEEIESIIEEDRPRIMASGQSYPPDHGYGTHGESDGYEHNESYLTYFSAPKSSASRTAEFFIAKIFKFLQRDLLQKFQLSLSSNDITAKHIENTLTMTFINNLKWNLMKITQIILTMTTYCCKQLQLQLMLIKFIITVMVILLAMTMIAMQWQQRKKFHRKYHQMMMKMTTTKDERKNEKMKCNCIEKQMKQQQLKKKNLAMNLLYEKLYKVKRWQQQEQQQQQHQENENCYLDANNDDCQGECEQQQQQQEQLQHQHHSEQCLVANQNVVNEKVFLKDTTITSRTISKNTNETSTTSSTDVATTTTTADSLLDCQQHVSQTLAFTSISSFSAMPSLSSILSSSSSSSSTTLGYRKTYAPDSFPLYALDASKSNNAKYMSKDQTLLMTSTTSTTPTAATIADDNTTDVVVTSTHLTYTLASVITPSPSSLPPSSSASTPSASVETLGAPSELLQTSATVSVSPFFRNNNLMAFIGELLLHQC